MKFNNLPLELWGKVFTFLDLESQRNVSFVSHKFSSLISSTWRTKLIKISSDLGVVSCDYQDIKHNLVMRALIDQYSPLEKCSNARLFKMIKQHKILKSDLQDKRQSMINREYSFYHDYHIADRKYLDLYQKWPRPGKKSLEKFHQGNMVENMIFYCFIIIFFIQDLVCLCVEDCRENIEAVHYFTSNFRNLHALKLLATDPLCAYSEILHLSKLQYLELQFDSFYREHREGLILRLSCLSNLMVC